MRKLLFLFGLLTVAACQGGAGPIDAQKFLSTLEGPKVPTVQDTFIEQAKNAEKQGDFQGAAQIYKQLLEKSPDDKNIMLPLAECYRRMGNFDEAITGYDAILKKDPAMVAAKEGKALALIAKGDFETSGPLLEEVLKADATRWKTLNALGILFTTRNLHSEAQQYFNAALKQNQNNASVLNNLGLSQALSKNIDASITTLTHASTIVAADSMERKRIDMNLSLVYAVAGKLDESRAIAERYYTGAVLNNNLGLYAHLAKDDQMAKAYLNMALTDSKTFYERAWDNLQTISGNSSEPLPKLPDTNAVKPEEPTKTEEAKKPEAANEKSKTTVVKEPVKVKTDTVRNLADQLPKSAIKTEAKPDPVTEIISAEPDKKDEKK